MIYNLSKSDWWEVVIDIENVKKCRYGKKN